MSDSSNPHRQAANPTGRSERVPTHDPSPDDFLSKSQSLAGYSSHTFKILSKISLGRHRADGHVAKSELEVFQVDQRPADFEAQKRKAHKQEVDEIWETTKARAKQYKADKQAQRADEKARNKFMRGVAWGFDPVAGVRLSSEEAQHDTGCNVSGRKSRRRSMGVKETCDVGKPIGQRWASRGSWGIECGGPGREGRYLHGSLQNKGKDEASGQ